MLNIEIKRIKGYKIYLIVLQGAMDHSAMKEMDKKLFPLIREGIYSVILNMSKVDHIASAAIAAIVEYYSLCKKHT